MTPVRAMTREQVVAEVRRMQREAGGLRALCARQGVHISTLSNMLGGRNTWTVRVLRLLGLGEVQVVDNMGHQGRRVPAVPRLPQPARRMWKLGDWPSRYRVTEA